MLQREPEISQLCRYLNKMGAKISGIDTNKLVINGVEKLTASDVEIIPDRIEVGTFLAAGALLGKIKLNHLNPKHLTNVLQLLEKLDVILKRQKIQ